MSADPNPLAGEQTWPTADELLSADAAVATSTEAEQRREKASKQVQ